MSDKITKQEWIDALRSGDYEQARRTLMLDANSVGTRDYSQAGSHCCLGVLSSLRKIDEDGLAVYPQKWHCTFDPHEFFSSEKLLELDIWTEQQQADIGERPSHFFSDLNDRIEASFDQIADVIEHLVEEVPA